MRPKQHQRWKLERQETSSYCSFEWSMGGNLFMVEKFQQYFGFCYILRKSNESLLAAAITMATPAQELLERGIFSQRT
jgi:hypothetical protein